MLLQHLFKLSFKFNLMCLILQSNPGTFCRISSTNQTLAADHLRKCVSCQPPKTNRGPWHTESAASVEAAVDGG